MNELKNQEKAAIEAVAGHFSATWEKGEGPPDAYIVIGERRIAVEITTIRQRLVNRGISTKPRLRFDRVAIGFVRRLQIALHDSVPDGKTVILTVTAPIRLSSKTAEALEDKIRACLARRTALGEVKDTIHGNRVRVRIVKGGSRQGSKVIGFVHNPDSDPDALMDLTQSLLDRLSAEAGKRVPSRLASERWLVVANENGLPYVETYRHVCSQLSIPDGFKKILMVFAGGQVETLTDPARAPQRRTSLISRTSGRY